MQDFLAFRRMMTPVIIQVVFWIGVIACIVGGVDTILKSGDSSIKMSSGLATLILGPIAVRIFCELLILFFRMNETLTDIRNMIEIQGNFAKPAPERSPSSEVFSTKPFAMASVKDAATSTSPSGSSVKEESEEKKPKLQFKTKEEYEKWKAERMKQVQEKGNETGN